MKVSLHVNRGFDNRIGAVYLHRIGLCGSRLRVYGVYDQVTELGLIGASVLIATREMPASLNLATW